jgi:hypothetical protein
MFSSVPYGTAEVLWVFMFLPICGAYGTEYNMKAHEEKEQKKAG